MMAGTPKGKEVRMYFLECENIAKQTLKAKPQQLPSTYEKATCVNNLAASLQMFGIEIDNPRFKQATKDLVCDILRLNQNQLSATHEKWLGVAERAEQLGYSVALVCRFRSPLGKFVKASGLKFKEESRLCNGTERNIKLYLLTDELDAAIKEYMDAKVLAN